MIRPSKSRPVAARGLLVAAAVLLTSSSAFAERRPLSDADAFVQETNAWADATLEALGVVPAFALAVVVDDEVVLAEGYGTADRELGLAADADTQFYIASSTKPFTALLAAIHDARGTIALDSPLAHHLDGAALAPELVPDQVRMRDLLTHTSGIDNGPIGFRVAYSGDHDPETLWALLPRSTAMEEAPLGTYRYTNVGYNLYTMMLDRETGTRWQDQLQQHLFAPLGLERTTAYVSRGEAHGWPSAAPYFGLDPNGIHRYSLQKKDNTMQSAGGLLTTARDAGRWLEFQLNHGRLDGRQLVDAEIVRRTHEKLVDASGPSLGFDQTGYGLGWSHGTHRERTVLSHGGGFAGFRSVLSFMPEAGIGVAVMVNESSAGTKLVSIAAHRAYDWWLGEELGEIDAQVAGMAEKVDVFRERVRADREKRGAREWQLARPNAAYTGSFFNELYGTITVEETGDGLSVRLGNLHCEGEAFTKPETMRVELVPGTGEVFSFLPVEGPVETIHYDGEDFARVPTEG